MNEQPRLSLFAHIAEQQARQAPDFGIYGRPIVLTYFAPPAPRR